MRSHFTKRRFFGLCAATAFGLAGWGFWLEPSHLTVNESDLPVAGWRGPALKIAVIADLHTGSPYNGLDRLESVVARTNAAHPDLVVLLGDYVSDSVPGERPGIHGCYGGRFIPPAAMAPILAKLRAPRGVYAVLGNHDWTVRGEMAESLASAGIPLLRNEARALPGPGGVWLSGTDEAWHEREDLPRALAGVPEGAPLILLNHSPDLFPRIPGRAGSLTLAAHTHGGQVRLPIYGALVVPSIHGRKYARGRFVEAGRTMYVAPGIGLTGLPVRFLAPPEVTLLDVHGG